jgi:hypothetical protein
VQVVSDDLVSALVSASQPADVVDVLMSRSAKMSMASADLPQPVIQVIQQIQSEAAKVDNQLGAAAAETVSSAKSGRTRGRRGVRSTARVVRGFTGLQPRAPARGRGPGMEKINQLAKRLQELIALAERQPGSARSQVRMAEDSAVARAEGQAAPTSPEGEKDGAVDVDALTREVTEAVSREIEMRRERRQEDPDGHSIWW